MFGRKMKKSGPTVSFENVSKWYGEVLGISRVSFHLEAGFTGLVGPNGSGKSTLMNLITGLLFPQRGVISVCGFSPSDSERIRSIIGYVHQFNQVLPSLSAFDYLYFMLRADGLHHKEAVQKSEKFLFLVGLHESVRLRIASFSKGMKQRLKIARALAREPQVLVLDEPLSGLDPLSRKDMGDLFSQYADRGNMVIMSSHILAEIENLTRHIIMIDNGRIVAEGELDQVRQDMKTIPMKIFIRTKQPAELAAHLFTEHLARTISRNEDGKSITVHTDDSDVFLRALNTIAQIEIYGIDLVTTIDDDMESIYHYLILPAVSTND